MKSFSRAALYSATVASLLGTAAGQSATNAIADAANLSLEELINIEITSVGKKETSLLRSPAAVAVLTAEDIRRLGSTSIPEALRAVPGLNVARLSANRWAITSRGFNDEYSNKLLVLVDGRSVYTPTFGGVYWNVQDYVLEDLDRIEVIRGPGATLWGANAVNGVINIITKSAAETQGGLVSTSFGTEDQPSVSVRYGGKLATNVFYRVYAKYFNRDAFDDAQGRSMSDDCEIARGGARVDWQLSDLNTVTFSGDYYDGTFGEQVAKTSVYPQSYQVMGIHGPTSGGNILGRWTSRFSDESDLKLQVYYDHYHRGDPYGGGVLIADPDEFAASQNRMQEFRDTWDVDLQHRFSFGSRQDIVWGLGYRRIEDNLETGGTQIQWSSERSRQNLFSAFLQDEITIVEDRLHLTLGSKFEHNDYTGLEIQPGGRLLWTPTEHQTLWGGVARAVRTPTRLEHDSRVDLFSVPGTPPVLVSSFGNPNADSEELLAYEIGYRWEPVRKLSFDVAAFYNDYDLLTQVVGQGRVETDPAPIHWLQPYETVNDVHAYTYGTELLAHWQPVDFLRLTAGYTWLENHTEGNPYISQTSPEHQFQFRTTWDLGHNLEFNTATYYVDSIKALPYGAATSVTIPSYVRQDVGLIWKPTSHLELSVWGQNLLDAGHPEFGSYRTPNIAEIPRSFYGKVTWRF
jgi:iron complex outermembrane receptor protein